MVIKKRILIRIGSLRHGGAEKVLITFLKNIPSDKYDIDLLLNLKSGKYLKELPSWINLYFLNKGEMIPTNRIQDIPVKIFRKLYQGLFKVFPWFLYKCILKGKEYDVELIANHTLINELINSPQKKSKKIAWIHSDIFNNSEIKDFSVFFQADKILVISDKIRKSFLDLAKDNQNFKDKIIRIFNPIDSNEILEKADSKIDYSFEQGIKTIIGIGTIYPAKGFDRLAEAHIKLIKEGFNHKILIIGDGYDFDKLKTKVEDLAIKDTFILLGFKDNPYPYLKSSGCFILSSRYEGYPTVLFEALTLKKNIIATNVSGVSEILENGEFGMIVENSTEGIYDGLKSYLNQDNKFDNYKENLEKTSLPFTLDNAVKDLMKIIDQ